MGSPGRPPRAECPLFPSAASAGLEGGAQRLPPLLPLGRGAQGLEFLLPLVACLYPAHGSPSVRGERPSSPAGPPRAHRASSFRPRAVVRAEHRRGAPP